MKDFCLVGCLVFVLNCFLLFDFIFINLSQDIIESIHSNINVLYLIKETGQSVMQSLIQWQQPNRAE